MVEEYIGTVAICGDEGTGKTSMALTFPKPIRHFDIDVGGYRRAIWRLSAEGISTKGYPKPIQLDKLMGAQQASASTRAITPKRVTGMLDLWQAIVQDFVEACMNQDMRTIVLDSSTLLWNICHNSHLEELQDKQLSKWKADPKTRNTPFDENDYRERLQPIEYGPANDRMRTVLHTARSYQKNLVLTHYPTDEYGAMPDGKGGMADGKTGLKILDGFKETAKLVDMVMWVSIKDMPNGKQPMAKITKCGLEGMGLGAVGLEIPATYEGIINLQNMMRGVANA